MERAEAVLDQMEIKKAKSLNRGKTIKARRVWISCGLAKSYGSTHADKIHFRLIGKI